MRQNPEQEKVYVESGDVSKRMQGSGRIEYWSTVVDVCMSDTPVSTPDRELTRQK